jgi:hypothetical protein
MTRVEWSLTKRLRARSLPYLSAVSEDHGGRPARVLWQVLARGSHACPPSEQCAGTTPNLLRGALARAWMACYPG